MPGFVSIRFHTGSEEAEVPASSARLMAVRNSIPWVREGGFVPGDLGVPLLSG